MRAFICIVILFLCAPLYSQEDCLNGMDDDGDGLVDLNDVEDCDCVEPVASLISEDYNTYTCCPTNFTGGPGTGIYCLEGGWTLVGGTSDYFNTCGYLGGGPIPQAPQPFPSEGGVVGSINTPAYNEYIGYCLPNAQLIPVETYVYSLYVGFNNGATTWNSAIPTEIGIFGTTDCAVMDDFNFSCLEGVATWDLLESFTVGGNMGEWTFVQGSFVNSGDYEGIAFGPTCQSDDLYTFYDDFTLDGVFNLELVSVDDDITESGDCINGVTLAVALTGYNYQWYLDGVAISGATGMTYDVPPGQEGEYQVMVYDANGCGLYEPYQLFINENILNIDADIMDVQCFEEANGSIILDLNGGNQPYDVMWLSGLTDPSISGLTPGSYPVTITDANGCVDITSFTVGGPPGPLEIEISNIQQPKGLIEVATASVDVTGGTQPYDILWANQETGVTATNLQPGFHTVMVTDANGCEAMTDLLIHPPLIVELNFQNISCFDCDGFIDVTVSGGLPDYTIDWNTGSGAFSISDLCEMEYTYLVTDAAGTECFGFQYIESTPPIEITEIFYDEYICFGNTEGNIDVNIDGGTPDYSFLWSNNSMEEDLVNVPPGNYTLVVTDDAGCTSEKFYSITELQEIEVDYATVEVDCASGLGGEIELFIQGGLPGYTVVWNNNMQGETISGLSAGNYSAVITDSNNCTAEVDVFLSGSTDLTFNPTIVNASCEGVDNGSITVEVLGSTNVTYLWEDNSEENFIDSLSTGTYVLVVTDESGCTTQLSYDIETDDDFEILASFSDTICFGSESGFINLDIVSGANLSFMWDGGEQTQNLSMLTAGEYSVVVNDENMCQQVFDFTIEEGEEITITPMLTDEECSGDANGSIALTASGGAGNFSYVWEDNSEMSSLTGLSEGTYSVTLTDDKGCALIDSFTIDILSNISIDGMVEDAGCGGEAIGSIDLILTGGNGTYDIAWDSGQMTEDIENLGPGEYTVVITDDLGCMSTEMFTVGSGANVNLEVAGENLMCFEDGSGTITITVTGGTEPISYFLNGDAVGDMISGLDADNYLIEIMDAEGCGTSTTIDLTQPPLLEAQVVSTTDVDVSGFGSASIAVQGGVMPYDITWDNGEMGLVANMLTAGMHTVTILDANGCPLVLNVDIGSSLLAIEFEFTENICFGECNGTIDISVLTSTGDVSFMWDDGQITPGIANLCNGEYSCIVQDEAGNTEEVIVTITSNDAIGITPTVADVLCFGEATGSIDLEIIGGSGNYDITINGQQGATSNTMLAADNYLIELVDDDGCEASVIVDIGSPAELIVSGSTNPISCFDVNDGSIDIVIEGGVEPYTTNWMNGISSPENLSPGEYELTVLDANGCETNASFAIEPLQEVTVDVLAIDPNCDLLGSIQILWNTAYPVLLNNAPVTLTPDGFIENLGMGSYALSFMYSDDCEVDIANVDLVLEDFLLNGVSEETVEAEFGELVSLDISELEVNGPYTLAWLMGNEFTCTETDQYGNCIAVDLIATQHDQIELVVSNTEGCQESFFFDITLVKSDKVYVPNIITGRLDEKFKFFAQSDLARMQSFEIYDRWGERIYLEEDVFINSMEGWDLQFQQKNVVPGIYVYYAKVEFPDGSTEIFAGDITVIF